MNKMVDIKHELDTKEDVKELKVTNEIKTEMEKEIKKEMEHMIISPFADVDFKQKLEFFNFFMKFGGNPEVQEKMKEYFENFMKIIIYSDNEQKNKKNSFYLQGEVYMADLGIKEGSVMSGKRPVVLIQNPAGLKYSPICTVAPLTTKPCSEQKTQVSLIQDDFLDNSLELYGTVQCEQSTIISKGQLLYKMGKVKPQSMLKILAADFYNKYCNEKHRTNLLKEMINIGFFNKENLEEVLNDIN